MDSDCPGLNAVIRAVVRKGIEVYGQKLGLSPGCGGLSVMAVWVAAPARSGHGPKPRHHG
jgi:hypothetical protein